MASEGTGPRRGRGPAGGGGGRTAADRLGRLVQSLATLPGVGPRAAQRMAYHMLQHDRGTALALAASLEDAARHVQHCARCHTFTDDAVCAVCSDPKRDAGLLLVVETPADQAAVERSGSYRGLYFVLMGRVSPLDGVGPDDIGMEALLARVEQQPPREVILATGFSAEGEATAHLLAQALRARGIAVTRMARGVPVGSDLEYVDLSTLAHALQDRR